jgi:tetratricopeptide (TPR) repeat protein
LAVGAQKNSVVALVAQVRFASGDRDGALALLREGRASAANDVELGLVSANMQAGAGDLRTAPAIYDDLVFRHLDAIALLLERGKHALSVGDLDGATADATQILARLPQAAQGHLLLGDVAMAGHDYPSAIEHFLRAVPLDASGLVSIKTGHAHRLVGELGAAEAAFKARLKYAPPIIERVYRLRNYLNTPGGLRMQPLSTKWY